MTLKAILTAAVDAATLKLALCAQYVHLKLAEGLKRLALLSYPTFLLAMATAMTVLVVMALVEGLVEAAGAVRGVWDDRREMSYRAWRDDYRHRARD